MSDLANTNSSVKKSMTTHQVVLIGVMSAIVFVANYISFPIPLSISGDATRIHVANAFCLLSGMLLGPIGGGLSAGIGSMFYDFTNPIYISGAPFTFIFKFLLAFTAGKLVSAPSNQSASTPAPSVARTILAGCAGQLVYIVLYIGKKFIKTYFLLGAALGTALVDCATALFASTVNAVFAVFLCVLLAPVFRKAMFQINRG